MFLLSGVDQIDQGNLEPGGKCADLVQVQRPLSVQEGLRGVVGFSEMCGEVGEGVSPGLESVPHFLGCGCCVAPHEWNFTTYTSHDATVKPTFLQKKCSATRVYTTSMVI